MILTLLKNSYLKRGVFLAILIWLNIGISHAASVVIVNPSVQAEDIDAQTLGRIYAMQIKNWNDGQPVRVFTFPSNSKVHHQFVISKMKIQPHQLERLWNRLIFTGTGRTPTIVNSAQEMLQKVKSTPGAIGYVTDSDVTSGVKVLVVGK